MKIICKKTDLAKAVQTVSKAVPAKATTSILECLLLRAEKEEITLTGNNLELGIETVMPGNIEEEGSIAIQAKVFGEMSYWKQGKKIRRLYAVRRRSIIFL